MELGNTFGYSGGDSDNTNLLDLKFHLEKNERNPVTLMKITRKLKHYWKKRVIYLMIGLMYGYRTYKVDAKTKMIR